MGKIVITRTSRSTAWFRIRTARSATSGWLVRPVGRKDLEPWAQIEADRRCGPTPFCWAGAATTGRLALSARPVPGRTGSTASQVRRVHDPERPVWQNTTVLTGELPPRSQAQAGTPRRNSIYASYQLGQTLIEHDLVTRFRLFVFPVIVGAGKRCSARPATRSRSASRHQDDRRRARLPHYELVR